MIYDPTRAWDVAETEITFLNNNAHYLYLMVEINELATTSEVIASEDHIDPLRDEGYIIYKLGSVGPVIAGKREAHMLWGNSKPAKTTYRHTQTAPSRVWEVVHNLGKFPSVTITDADGNEYESEVKHIDLNNTLLTFSEAFAGFADLN
jgi:hypothetical protein